MTDDIYPGDPVPTAWKVMVELKLQNPGITGKELRKVLGYNQQTIYLWQRRADYQKYENWALRRESTGASSVVHEASLVVETTRIETLSRVRERFESYTEEMQDRLLTIIRMTDNEKLQAELCQDFLDRAGVEKVKPRDAPRATPILFTTDAVKEFFSRASEAGLVPERQKGSRQEPGPVIDIEKAS